MLFIVPRKTLTKYIKRFIVSFVEPNVCNVRHLCSQPTKVPKKEMVRILNVAEKNDAAKNIAELMSGGRYRRRDGRSVYNKIYEFDYNVFNQRCHMIMTSVSGHLLNLEFSGSYRKWQACNPVTLFDAPVIQHCSEDFQGIKETLEREVRTCQHLIIWTDCDREGENIGFEIIEVCTKVKPNITVHRAQFSEITKAAVTRAINNLVAPDQRLSDAVNVRKELDLRIGAAFTRFQTLRLQKVFPDVLSNQLVSYGSCQFPTLGFVVERYKQVQAFVPEEFYKIKVSHKKNETTTEFSWKRGRLFDHTACLALYQVCLENPLAKVTDIRSRPKSKWRPQPLDTVELEKIASRKLHINAKQALNIAEKLYSKGYISYPRTETTIFPKELDLSNLVQMQCNDPDWGNFASRVLEDGPNPRQGSKTDNAHPPIHPIKYTNSLEGNEKAIYEFVVRRFLACLSKDAEGRETTVNIEINSEKFAVSGLMIIARNYLEVYPYEKWSNKEIAEYSNGEVFMPTAIEMTEGETSPPELLTEADLIALMDKHGIGTDATHSEHIETIKSRLYVGLTDNARFVPGQLGMGLVEGYDLMGFHMSKPHLRAELEADLKRICEGTKNPKAVLEEQVAKYKQYFIETVQQAAKIDSALANYFQLDAVQAAEVEHNDFAAAVLKCPRCSGDITIKEKKDRKGYFLSCLSYPQCTAAIWFPDCVEKVTVTDEVCSVCQPGPVFKLKFNVKRGSLMPFYEDEFVACVGGCDSNVLEVMNIRPLSAVTRNPPQAANNSVPRNRQNSDSAYGTNQSTESSHVSSSQRSGSLNSFFAPNSDRSSAGSGSNFRPASSFSATSPPSAGSLPKRSSGSITFVNGFNSDGSKIVCSCSKPAILLTVKKEGANKGRRFYKCDGPADKQCGFFLWEDAANFQSANTSNGIQQNRQPQSSSNNRNQRSFPRNDSEEVHCSCDQPARLLTVTKEGPNTGRKFYKCRNFGNDACSFFQWADDDAGPSNNSNKSVSSGGRKSQKRPSSSSSTSSGPTTSKRKCGLCCEEGHTRKTCPMSMQ